MGDYHNLEVWHLACQLSDRIYFLVEGLGKRINPSKADQLLRAADGIHENIAEGALLATVDGKKPPKRRPPRDG